MNRSVSRCERGCLRDRLASFRGLYSCPVKKSFIIIYLCCRACRKKGDDEIVACSDCSERDDETLEFVLLGPHDEAYGI